MARRNFGGARLAHPGWWWVGGLAGLGFLLAVGGGLAGGLPQTTQVFPPAGASGLAAGTSIYITFNQPMNTAAVEAALQFNPPRSGLTHWEGNTLVFTPAEPWPTQSQVEVALTGGAAANGLPLLGGRRWTFAVGERRVLYLGGAPSPNVWLVPVALPVSGTVRPQSVTAEAQGVADFALSPDGAEIVYAAWRPDGGADLRRVWLLDGAPEETATDVLRCPDEACLAPTFSPDGTWLAYQRHVLLTDEAGVTQLGGARLYVFNRLTGEDKLLSDPASDARAPQWNHNQQLAYLDPAQQSIKVVEVATGATLAFTTTTNVMGVWTPDDTGVVYPELAFLPEELTSGPPLTPDPLREGEVSANNPVPFYTYLVRRDLATGVVTNLSGAEVVSDAGPVFAPDGVWLAFARLARAAADQWAPGRQVWVMQADGGAAHPLTAEPLYNHSALRWSPDGLALVYTRFNTGEPGAPLEIWTINRDGTGARRLAIGYLPEWVP